MNGMNHPLNNIQTCPNHRLNLISITKAISLYLNLYLLNEPHPDIQISDLDYAISDLPDFLELLEQTNQKKRLKKQ
jgi:hypothetical protein